MFVNFLRVSATQALKQARNTPKKTLQKLEALDAFGCFVESPKLLFIIRGVDSTDFEAEVLKKLKDAATIDMNQRTLKEE